jgi:peptidoglycan/xylan/chitin deacetylase (PgdA/CDA1 family)
MYHRIAAVAGDEWGLSVDPGRFAEHLEVIGDHCRPVALPELAEAVERRTLAAGRVVITFDDGYRDNLEVAKPLLERYGIPATVFVASGYLDAQRSFWWDDVEEICLRSERLPQHLEVEVGDGRLEWDLAEPTVRSSWRDVPRQRLRIWPAPATQRHALHQALFQEVQPLQHATRSRVLDAVREAAGLRPSTHDSLTADEVSRLVEGGLIEVGAHTVTHPILTGLSPDCRREEIRSGKQHLEELVGRPVESFAYPNGRFDRDVVESVREAGFRCAVTTIARAVRRRDNLLRLPRFGVENWSGDEFERRLSSWGAALGGAS